jgi:hypothetical protein
MQRILAYLIISIFLLSFFSLIPLVKSTSAEDFSLFSYKEYWLRTGDVDVFAYNITQYNITQCNPIAGATTFYQWLQAVSDLDYAYIWHYVVAYSTSGPRIPQATVALEFHTPKSYFVAMYYPSPRKPDCILDEGQKNKIVYIIEANNPNTLYKFQFIPNIQVSTLSNPYGNTTYDNILIKTPLSYGAFYPWGFSSWVFSYTSYPNGQFNFTPLWIPASMHTSMIIGNNDSWREIAMIGLNNSVHSLYWLDGSTINNAFFFDTNDFPSIKLRFVYDFRTMLINITNDGYVFPISYSIIPIDFKIDTGIVINPEDSRIVFTNWRDALLVAKVFAQSEIIMFNITYQVFITNLLGIGAIALDGLGNDGGINTYCFYQYNNQCATKVYYFAFILRISFAVKDYLHYQNLNVFGMAKPIAYNYAPIHSPNYGFTNQTVRDYLLNNYGMGYHIRLIPILPIYYNYNQNMLFDSDTNPVKRWLDLRRNSLPIFGAIGEYVNSQNASQKYRAYMISYGSTNYIEVQNVSNLFNYGNVFVSYAFMYPAFNPMSPVLRIYIYTVDSHEEYDFDVSQGAGNLVQFQLNNGFQFIHMKGYKYQAPNDYGYLDTRVQIKNAGQTSQIASASISNTMTFFNSTSKEYTVIFQGYYAGVTNYPIVQTIQNPHVGLLYLAQKEDFSGFKIGFFKPFIDVFGYANTGLAWNTNNATAFFVSWLENIIYKNTYRLSDLNITSQQAFSDYYHNFNYFGNNIWRIEGYYPSGYYSQSLITFQFGLFPVQNPMACFACEGGSPTTTNIIQIGLANFLPFLYVLLALIPAMIMGYITRSALLTGVVLLLTLIIMISVGLLPAWLLVFIGLAVILVFVMRMRGESEG